MDLPFSAYLEHCRNINVCQKTDSNSNHFSWISPAECIWSTRQAPIIEAAIKDQLVNGITPEKDSSEQLYQLPYAQDNVKSINQFLAVLVANIRMQFRTNLTILVRILVHVNEKKKCLKKLLFEKPWYSI